jgi:uncharacterized membrane protein YhaH (DUF805 family)
VINKIEKYFFFTGNATRSEYWGVNIISYLLLIPILIVGIIFTFGGLLGSVVGGLLILVGVVALSWAVLATTARRCRDAGINPWFAGTILIPWLAIIPFIVFGCLKSNASDK